MPTEMSEAEAIEAIKNTVGDYAYKNVYGAKFMLLEVEQGGASLVLHLDSIYVDEEDGFVAMEATFAGGHGDVCLCCLQEMAEERYDLRVIRSSLRDDNPDEGGWHWFSVYFHNL